MAGTYTRDPIVSSSTSDERLRQVIQWVNGKEGWTTTGSVGFDSPIRSLGIKVAASNSLTYSESVAYLNSAANLNRRIRNRLQLSVSNRSIDIIDVESSIEASYNRNAYSLNRQFNQSYVNGTLSGRATWHFAANTSLELDATYRILGQNAFGPMQNILQSDIAVSYLLLRGDGEIHLELKDIFNENLHAAITSDVTFIE